MDKKINRKEENPSYCLVKDSLGLVGDLCEHYGREMKGYLDTQIIRDMIDKLEEKFHQKKIKD